MNAPSPFGAVQDQRDRDHLNLLSIFHYIWAAFALVGIGFIVVHYLVMTTVMSGAMANSANSSSMPQFPPQIMELFKVFYVVAGFMLVTVVVLNVLSAIFLRQRKHRVFSIVVACMNCIQIPLGTTLGIFTLIVLMRESVREGYERGQGN